MGATRTRTGLGLLPDREMGGVKRPYSMLAHQPGSGLDKLLGGLEREVMEILWARGEGSVRSVLEALNAHRAPDHQLAYTTVMTVMARLADKGLLRRTLVGKAHEYEVAESRDAFLARASRDIARQMVQDFGEAAIAGFISVLEGVAPERLAKLRKRAQERGQSPP
jgi:predicted transcriptional regulator